MAASQKKILTKFNYLLLFLKHVIMCLKLHDIHSTRKRLRDTDLSNHSTYRFYSHTYIHSSCAHGS